MWCGGWRLASAVNGQRLGLIGAGSMHPEVLRQHTENVGLLPVICLSE